MDELTSVELSLLLFFETCAVDRSGRVNTAHMNTNDLAIAKRWDTTGFVLFGRVASEDIDEHSGSMWCKLSDEAWAIVHAERRQRALRLWNHRNWRTTHEKREDT